MEPGGEERASDRAHRIGQTRSVFVHKLIATDTVEERIVALQQRKAALASLALTEDGATLPPIDAEDIDYLFGVTRDLLAARDHMARPRRTRSDSPTVSG